MHSLGQSKSSELAQIREKGNKFHMLIEGMAYANRDGKGILVDAIFGDCLPQLFFPSLLFKIF